MATKITILGAGPGGYIAAIRAAQLGAEVTVIEQDNVGGVCLNWGCIPSKIMKTSAELLDKLSRAAEYGIKVTGGFQPDMERLMSEKEKVVQNQRKGILRLFDNHKIRYLKGQGFIRGVQLVAVRLPDGETVEVSWDKLIIATGSCTFEIPSLPLDGERIISSNEAVNLRKIPDSILIIGGGAIGCEFAFIFNAFGSKVTVVEAMSRMLPFPCVDENCSKILQREMKKHKINFFVDRCVETAEKSGGKVCVTMGPLPFSPGTKKKKGNDSIEVDTVLVSIGRKPNTSGIGLEKIGVALDEGGWVITNDTMETNIPGVYAIGDVLGPQKVMLAHVASTEGITAADNAMGGNQVMRYAVIPGAIYTMPEVANVGMTEAQALEKGYEVRSDSVLFRAVGMAQVIKEIAGEAKIISDRYTCKILGVHMIGAHAAELIAEGALAIQTGCTLQELAETIHAHPTLAEIMLESSLKALDRPRHG